MVQLIQFFEMIKFQKKTNIQYTCIAEINIDSVMKMDKKNYPQVHLKESKCEINKNKMVRFINAE